MAYSKLLAVLFTFTVQELTDILAHLQALISIFNGRESTLTDDQRKKGHATDKRKQFVSDAHGFSDQYSFLVPSNDTSADNQTRLQLIRQIEDIERHSGQAFTMFMDTMLAAAIDTYGYSLSVYARAKEEEKEGRPGMKEVVDVLKKNFEGQGNPHTPPVS